MYAAPLGEVSAVAFSGPNQVFYSPSTWTLGYAPGRPGADQQESLTAFGMGGAGGSYGYADPATGIAFALTKNRLTADFNAAERVAAIVAEPVVAGAVAGR